MPQPRNIAEYSPDVVQQHLVVQSLCPNAERCGSCGWSHIPYDKQLKQKLADINGSFAFKKLNCRVNDILPSPRTAHYRNRMDFVIDFQGNVGLREKGKWWRVIDNHMCFLADEKIETLFRVVRAWAKAAGISCFDRKTHTGLLRYAVIRATAFGETMINVVTSAPNDELLPEALHDLADVAKVTTVVWSINHNISDVSTGDEVRVIDGEGVIHEEVDGFRYRISPNAFFQTNSHAAPLLLETVRMFAGDLHGKTLLDLYCGSGFFSVALSRDATHVVGVEVVTEAINDARQNVALNHKLILPSHDATIPPIHFYDAKAEEFDWKTNGADVVIVDPPRSGMHDKTLQDIVTVKPKRMVYVSCNPKNFAREMVTLQKYYAIDAMCAIDLFPHTPHVELVTALERKSLTK